MQNRMREEVALMQEDAEELDSSEFEDMQLNIGMPENDKIMLVPSNRRFGVANAGN